MSRSFNYSNFFELSDPLASRPLRVSPREQDWIKKNSAFELFIGEFTQKEPVLFRGVMGSQAVDILWSDLIPLMCISERIVNVLLDNKITGWGTYPVEVYDRKGNYLPHYYGFSVISFAGEIELHSSQIISRSIRQGGKPIEFYKGLYFDERQWDGSDIFRVNHAVIIINRRAQAILKHEKISNIRYTIVPDVERPVATFHLEKYV